MTSAAQLFEPIVGARGVLTATHDLEYYGQDWCKEFPARPSCIVLPHTIEHIVDIVRCCRRERLALVPSGGRTGLSGGATASNGEVVLSLEKMNKILCIDVVGRTLVSQAGATLEALCRYASERGLFYPIDIASKGSCQIGGTVATNAGGIRVIRYGNTRDWVLGLKVVTGTGDILNLNGALYKNQSGYDLKSLFIGSEGTLGVVVEVTVRLTEKPPPPLLFLAAIGNASQALVSLQRLRTRGFTIQVFEYFEDNALSIVLTHNPTLSRPLKRQHPAYILVEVEQRYAGVEEELHQFLNDEMNQAAMLEVALAQNARQYSDLMSLRERISESIAKTSIPHKNDVSVPVASLAQFLDELKEALRIQMPSSSVVVFGHFGDGNLHINILKPKAMSYEEFVKHAHNADKVSFEIVSRFGGSISAEHGVGLLKRDFLSYTRSAYDVDCMRQLKKVFDPDSILNPGKIFS